MNRLEKSWYQPNLWTWMLIPVSFLFQLLVFLRRTLYRRGILKSFSMDVPVIIVGNITVGGTGKTPTVIWLVDFLRQNGYRPGIISRGYHGKARSWPQQVRPDSDPVAVGDEPVLLARRCQCPIAVGPDRVAAARALLEHSDCNIIVSDDGLQHYRLHRDLEIAVIDGIRRFGNGYHLPAGPLRESRRRLNDVDYIVCNGLAARGEYAMRLDGQDVINPLTGETRSLDSFKGSYVHAVAGIGDPNRFFQALKQHEINVIEHPFDDHHVFKKEDIPGNDDTPVFMTEKDAVKCARFGNERAWVVPVSAVMDEHLGPRLLSDLQKMNNSGEI